VRAQGSQGPPQHQAVVIVYQNAEAHVEAPLGKRKRLGPDLAPLQASAPLD
jgi:hypothetical protein